MFEAVQWRTTPDYAPNVSKHEKCKHTLKRVRKFVCESRFMLYNKSQKSTFYRYYIRYALTVKSYHRTSSYIILQHLCAAEHHQTEGKKQRIDSHMQNVQESMSKKMACELLECCTRTFQMTTRFFPAAARYDGCKSVEFLLPLFIQWHDSKLRSLLNFTCEHIIIFSAIVCECVLTLNFFSGGVLFYWKMLRNMNFWTFFVFSCLSLSSSLVLLFHLFLCATINFGIGVVVHSCQRESSKFVYIVIFMYDMALIEIFNFWVYETHL